MKRACVDFQNRIIHLKKQRVFKRHCTLTHLNTTTLGRH